jgi:hypothetical protein
MMMSRMWHVKLVGTIRVAVLASMLLALLVPAAQAAATRLWVKRYDGPVDDVDEASSIAFDSAGNVYVAGRSNRGASHEDYLLIKYKPGGNLQWKRWYDGPAGNYDAIRAIVVDGTGNIYVTGASMGVGTHRDIATIKYDSNGNQKWVKRYSSSGYYEDAGMDIALDTQGNVIVTGMTTTKGSAFDFITIKYSATGTLKWNRGYNGPGDGGDMARAVAVDGNDNVYVTGPSMGDGTNWDICTIKYNSGGTKQWIKRWDSPAHQSDGATDIGVDASGFVYVTGYSYLPKSDSDYMTIKYGPGGWVKWTRRYDGPADGPDVAWALAIDGSAVYVTGASRGKTTSQDFATVRYLLDGTQKFVKRWTKPGKYDDVANAIAVGNNRVYVTGFSTRSTTSGDYFTIAYGIGGAYKWSNRYSGPAKAFDQGNAIGVNQANGNVYVTGGSGGVGSKSDFLTIGYAP